MTPAPPRLDLPGRRLWASPRHLGLLARVAAEGPAGVDHGPARDLADAGVLSADGEVIAALRPVARAAATAVGVAHVARLRGPAARQVQVRVGPDGVLVAPSGDDDEVGEVALQAPSAACRTLWRLLHLGPRPRPTGRRDLGPAPVERLVAGVRSGDERGMRQLGIEAGDGVLDRVQLHTCPDGADPAGLALLDTPEGCWRLEGGDESLTLRPADAVDLLDALADWQLALVGPDGDTLDADDAPRAAPRAVGLDAADVCAPVPYDWEGLAPAAGLALMARQPQGSGFCVNVTVALEPVSHEGRAPWAMAEDLAAGLDGGVAVDAWDEPAGGACVVVLHAAPDTDVVTLQRRLPAPVGAAAVSYTCGVTQWPSWSGALRRWASQATAGTLGGSPPS